MGSGGKGGAVNEYPSHTLRQFDAKRKIYLFFHIFKIGNITLWEMILQNKYSITTSMADSPRLSACTLLN